MKNVCFFVLFSIFLGITSLNAQVRIGSKNPANKGAVLDLNADDAMVNGILGLALPRVHLSTTQEPLKGGTPNINGMLVYNTNPALLPGDGEGIYYWRGGTTSTAKWIKIADAAIQPPLPSSPAPAPAIPTTKEQVVIWDTTVYESSSATFSVKIPEQLLGKPSDKDGKRFVAEAWRPDMTLSCFVTIRYEGDEQEPLYDSIVCKSEQSNTHSLDVPTYFRLREF